MAQPIEVVTAVLTRQPVEKRHGGALKTGTMEEEEKQPYTPPIRWVPFEEWRTKRRLGQDWNKEALARSMAIVEEIERLCKHKTDINRIRCIQMSENHRRFADEARMAAGRPTLVRMVLFWAHLRSLGTCALAWRKINIFIHFPNGRR